MKKNNIRSTRKSVRRKLLTLAVASCFATEMAYANPFGPTVINGQVFFNTRGNLLQITNTPGSIINWQGFSISASEITKFIQQSASSTVLNRVTGVDPSIILGALQSNGRVILINPNGVVFGAGSMVDTAGMVASTLKLSDADFLAGRLNFTDTPGAGSVINQGNITTTNGGFVYLVAPNIQNSGIIRSDGGEIILAAGKSVEIVNPNSPDVRVQIVAPDNQAVNLGQIIAQSGRIGIYGGLVRQGGTVSANSAVMGPNGKVVFKATKDVTLDAGSTTTATGAQGGSITIQSDTGTTLVSGTVEAKGDQGAGGQVQILGNFVGLTGNAILDASGQTGGGTVLIGGDYHGGNSNVQNAFRTYFGPDAIVRADAIQSGDGGKVIVWSDDITRAYGTISARGGAQSGNGGFVEVSSGNNLDFAALVNAGAPNGKTGTLLLDPQDITVSDTTTTNNIQLNAGTPGVTDPAGSIFFADIGTANAAANRITISDEGIEAQTANIVLQAARDITLNANLSGGGLVLTHAGQSLTMQAGRNITINSPVVTQGGKIILEADSPHSPVGAADGTGQLSVLASVTSNDGAITLIGGGNSIQNGGGIRFASTAIVDAGAGGLNVALSGNADLGIGSLGIITQILGNSSSTGTGSITNLHTSGPLAFGTATTGGTDGLGTGAITLIDNSIDNTVANSAIILANAPGTKASSLLLKSGAGGITLGQPLSTFQATTINTTGVLTINNTLSTSANTLTITASSVTLGANGVVNTAGASIDCSGVPGGCPAIPGSTNNNNNDIWNGGFGQNWFTTANWSNGIPGLNSIVTIPTGKGTIIVNGSAVASTINADSPIQIPLGGTLAVSKGSTFHEAFTLLSGGVLTTGLLADVGGSNGKLIWSGGSIGGAGTFTFDGAQIGQLSGTLGLNLSFTNKGNLEFSNAIISGSGSFTNIGTLTALATTTNQINTPLTNPGVIQVLGSLVAASFPTNVGLINISSGGTFGTNGNPLTNTTDTSTGDFGTIQVAVGGTLDLGGATFTNSGAAVPDSADPTLLFTATATIAGNYSNVPTTNVSGGTVTFNGTATTGTLNLSSTGTVNGTGSLTVTTNFSKASTATFGDPLGVNNFTNLDLTNAATFVVDSAGFTASNSVLLHSTSGGITLNGAVSAGGAGDAIVLDAKTAFVNNVGSAALSNPTGRWVVYSSDPALDTFGPAGNLLASGNQAMWHATFSANPPGTIASGNRYVFGTQPSLTYTANAATRTYGAGDPAFSGTVTGFVNASLYGNVFTQDTQANATTGTMIYTTPAVAASNVGAYALNGSGLTANNGNYTFAQAVANATAFSITPATLTYTANAATRTYGAADPAFSGTVTGFVLGQNQAGATTGTMIYTTPAVAASNVGAYALNGSGLTANNGNYTFAQAVANATAFSITPATLTYTANAATRTYGAADPAFSGTVTGFVLGQNQAGATTGTMIYTTPAVAASNVGAYALNGSGLTANNGNYTFAQAVANATAFSITPATLTYTANAATRTYGAADPAFSGTVTGFVLGQNQAGATTGTMIYTTPAVAASNVGAYALNGSGLTANNGNYTFAQAVANATAFSITPATLTYTANAATRTYGAADPAFSGTVTGFVLGQNQAGATTGTMIYTTPAVAASNVGAYALNGSGLTANNGNYTFAQAVANATAFSITPATLTYTANAATRTYGAADPAFSGTVTGFVLGQNQAGATTGTMIYTTPAVAASNVGAYALNGSGLTANNGNYTFAQAVANATAFSITPATLTYTANAATRTYGAADPAFSGTVTGFVLGQNQAGATTGTMIYTTPAVAASNVGAYALNGSGLTANNGNYTFAQAVANATAFSITPATLTYTANAATRTYGAADPAFSGTVTGFVLGQNQAGATTGTMIYTTPAVAASNVGAYALNGSGLTANNGNYTFAQAVANATAFSITPATLTYTANAATRTYGAADPAFSGTVTGFVLGQNQAGATTGTMIYTTPAVAASNVGAYALNGSGLTANNGNYTFAQAVANATAFSITPATLTYTANAATRTYGAADPAFSGTVTGFVLGQNQAGATTGTMIYTTPAVAASNVGAYALNGSGLTANNGNYTFAQAVANATAFSITPDPANFLWTTGIGQWNIGTNWNQGVAPAAGAVVTIPASGVVTYSLAAGSSNVNKVTSSGSFTMSGGALNLATNSSFSSLALTGGTITGTGSIAVSNFSQTGGTFGTSSCPGCFTTVDLTGSSFGFLSGLAASSSIALHSTGTLNMNASSLSAPTVTLAAINTLNLNGNVNVTGDLALKAGNQVTIDSAIVKASGAVGVITPALLVTAPSAPAQLIAGTDLGVIASNVTLLGGAGAAEIIGGPGTFAITTSGDISLTGGAGGGARIFGNPDVNLVIGGMLQLNGNAIVQSASPHSIIIVFPNLASGGIVGSAANSGFIAGPAPATLGTNLNIIYGLGAGSISTVTDTSATSSVTLPSNIITESIIFTATGVEITFTQTNSPSFVPPLPANILNNFGLPTSLINPGSTVGSPYSTIGIGSGSAGALVDTVTDMIITLNPVNQIDAGAYTNTDTGQTVFIKGLSSAEPGTYVNQGNNKVVVVKADAKGQKTATAGVVSKSGSKSLKALTACK